MFDLPGQSAPKDEVPNPFKRALFDLSLYNELEMLDLRNQIDQKLPVKSLKDLSMERELVLQLVMVQNLQRDVLGEDGVPANQKAQTAGAVAASLATLAKLQIDIYTSERLKQIEQILIETLQTLPREAQEAFMTAYEGAIALRM